LAERRRCRLETSESFVVVDRMMKKRSPRDDEKDGLIKAL